MMDDPYMFPDYNEDFVKWSADLKLLDYNELQSTPEIKMVKSPANSDFTTVSEIGETHNISWMDTYSKEEICKLQEDDPNIHPMIKWMKEQSPSQAEL